MKNSGMPESVHGFRTDTFKTMAETQREMRGSDRRSELIDELAGVLVRYAFESGADLYGYERGIAECAVDFFFRMAAKASNAHQ